MPQLRHCLRLLFLLTPLLLLAGTGKARELEPGATLEGFPFSTAVSVSVTSNQRDLYLSGGRIVYSSPTPGLVWLQRDLTSGKLTFRRNYLSSGQKPAVIGSALSPNETFLCALTPTQVLVFRRDSDGLTQVGEQALSPALRPQGLTFLPGGSDQLLVRGLAGHERYSLSANGNLTLIAAQSTTISNGYRALLSDDLFVSGDLVLRRVNGTWTRQAISTLISDLTKFGDVTTSPDRHYVYVRTQRGQFPFIGSYVDTYELVNGQLAPVAITKLAGNWEYEETALSIHPITGDLYQASYDTNGGRASWITHYRALEGGRTFVKAETLYDSSQSFYGRAQKGALTFSADGRHLYATFGGEPLALLEVDPATGELNHIHDAAGLYSHFVRPLKVVSARPQEAFVLTPKSLLRTRWDSNGLHLVDSTDLDDWQPSREFDLIDFVLTSDGELGVLASERGLALVVADANGNLRRLPELDFPLSYISPIGLSISQDGRFLYLLTYNDIWVYSLRRDGSGLALVQQLPLQLQSGGQLRFSNQGDAVTASSNSLQLFRRSLETGELTLKGSVPNQSNVQDFFFAPEGNLLYVFHTGEGQVPRNIEIFARQQDGTWASEALLEIGQAKDARQLIDADGRYLYQLDAGRLEMFGWRRNGAAFRLERIATVDNEELGGVGANIFQFEPVNRNQLELMAGDNELLISNVSTGNLRLIHRGCGSLDTGPCLKGNRFRVEVLQRELGKAGQPAKALPIGSDEAQLFSFFDDTNWEMMVKVLDGCGINNRFWVYAAATTDVGFDIRVTDTWSGEGHIYQSPAGPPAAAITDSQAFATCSATSPGWVSETLERTPLLARPDGLELGDRFVANASWVTALGQEGQGTGLRPSGNLPSGLFYFFSPDNWEVQMKVLNGCAINNHFWVFLAATTDVGYTIEVRDQMMGLTSRYTNPVGHASPAFTDTEAFPCN